VTERGRAERLRPPGEQPPDLAKFRILSIDGGGIRGVIPAVLLAGLERLLAASLQAARSANEASVIRMWEGRAEPRIADCFHLIAGTSTGGLITAGLAMRGADGRPEHAASYLVEVYQRQGPRIFHRPLWRNLLDHLNLLFPRYPLGQLRRSLEDPTVLGQARLQDALTEVLLTTYDTDRHQPRYFTRWGAQGAGSNEATPPETMVQAALATAAAPTYFDPALRDRSHLVDGGVFAGNPSLAAVSMALRRTQEPVPRDSADLFMVSLGTGSWEPPISFGWGGILGWLRPRRDGEALLEALLDGQGDFATEAAHMMLNGWTSTRLPGQAAAAGRPTWWDPNLPPASVGGGPRFWRYQPLLPGPSPMDDVSRLAALKDIGAELLERYEGELRRLAGALIQAGPTAW
jgi:hypothetical protein